MIFILKFIYIDCIKETYSCVYCFKDTVLVLLMLFISFVYCCCFLLLLFFFCVFFLQRKPSV